MGPYYVASNIRRALRVVELMMLLRCLGAEALGALGVWDNMEG
jgi:hypothetical protein